ARAPRRTSEKNGAPRKFSGGASKLARRVLLGLGCGLHGRLRLALDLDVDLLGHQPHWLRHGDLEEPVVELRGHLVRVDALRQREAPLEGAVRELASEVVCLLRLAS